MKPQEFVQAIRSVVLESSVKGVESVLQQPPGRKPQSMLLELSKWFNSLPDEQKKNVLDVAKLASHQAVFGFLAVIDGVRSIESTTVKGRFELRYISGNEQSVMNDPDGPQLHDILNQTQ